MDERGAVEPWRELEGVPEAQAKVAVGLLRGLAVPGLRRSSWAKLEELLGWRSDEPLFIEVTKRLFELAPLLDARRRALVLAFLAPRAYHICRSSIGVHRRAYLAFTAGGQHVLPLVSDRSADVRTHAAWLLRTLRFEDPAAREALRRQAAAERDPMALASQLLAVAALSGSGDRAATVEWLRPRLVHRHTRVRLAAARGVLLLADPGGAEGTGRIVARAFAKIGTGSLPHAPWWPDGYPPMKRYTDRLAAHPGEAEALVEGLARRRNPSLREEAVTAAGKHLRYWRRPSAHLWETVAAGLDDERGVAGAAAAVLARSGTGAAPYADRLVRALGHADSTGYAALRALVHLEDRRALSPYLAHFGGSFPEVAALPVRWAPDLLPAFRKRLTEGPEARSVDQVLRALAQWGPASAPAVPELTALLDGPLARPAAEALGRIGPAASAAAEALARLSRRETTPWGGEREHPPRPWQGVQTAAWAYWRVTGDPEPALRIIGAAAQAGPGRAVLRYLADLGPLAAPYSGAALALLGCRHGEWTRVGAARAWWRITGDPAPAVEALLPELAPLAEHRVTELTLLTVRTLGDIGRPAAAALPALRAVLASERRYGPDILRDEELCRAAREALARIGGP